MQFRIIAKVIGGLLTILGIIMLVPDAYSRGWLGHHDNVFIQSSAMALALGSVLWILNRNVKEEINLKTGFAVVAFSWLAVTFFGSLPYYLSGTLPNFIDALFESSSGFSTTGASVLTDIESVRRSILLWRSMTQWMGGMGIIVFFIAILPVLGVGGVQLFRAEVTGPQKDKITPRVRETAKKLWLLYFGYTIFVTLLIHFCGMPLFDSLNHAMTALSTGGFSVKNNGIAAYDSIAVDYALAFSMILASTNFGLHYKLFTHKQLKILNDTETKGYLGILAVAIFISTFALWGPVYHSFGESLRSAVFTIVNMGSCTGFTNMDYLIWPQATHFIIILLMVMGGSSGSTAGGIKCIRLIAAFKQLSKEIFQVLHPRAVKPVKANDHVIPPQVISAIWGFIFLYLFVFTIAALVLMLFFDLDMISSSTSVFTAMSNVGPAFGQLGPYDNYASLAPGAKLTLSCCMIMGRLEFYPFLVFFTSYFWKR